MMADQDLSFLYIEDHPASRRVMQLLLDVMGYSNLTLIEHTQDIIAQLEQTKKDFDVIFLDLHLSPLDGFEVQKLLRAHNRFGQAKIVALTASVMPNELHTVRQNFDGLIAKPLNYDTFFGYVTRILAGEPVWETS
ncbi:MAG: response regulator [Anaerolineae bacterium]|nr:response regulator [Anaerolineae bacterium]